MVECCKFFRVIFNKFWSWGDRFGFIYLLMMDKFVFCCINYVKVVVFCGVVLLKVSELVLRWILRVIIVVFVGVKIGVELFFRVWSFFIIRVVLVLIVFI